MEEGEEGHHVCDWGNHVCHGERVDVHADDGGKGRVAPDGDVVHDGVPHAGGEGGVVHDHGGEEVHEVEDPAQGSCAEGA